MPKNNVTVFLIEDDIAVCAALKALFESVKLKVETFSDAQQFLAKMTLKEKGCIVADVRMPGMSGIDLQMTLKAKRCLLPIILITGHGDIPMAVKAIKAGAFDFITKPFNNQTLLDQVQRALESIPVIQHQAMLKSYLKSLTPRERQILDAIVEGKLSKEITGQLNISLSTVEMYRSRILKKMHSRNLAELIKNYLTATMHGE